MALLCLWRWSKNDFAGRLGRADRIENATQHNMKDEAMTPYKYLLQAE
jgi:hypothetical protein